jgi:hypothetical protein
MMPLELSYFWKIDGVIQGSRTSQPPRLTPRTFSSAQEKGASAFARLSMITLQAISQLLSADNFTVSNLRRSPCDSSSAKRDDCVAEMHV